MPRNPSIGNHHLGAEVAAGKNGSPLVQLEAELPPIGGREGEPERLHLAACSLHFFFSTDAARRLTLSLLHQRLGTQALASPR